MILQYPLVTGLYGEVPVNQAINLEIGIIQIRMMHYIQI